MESPKANILRLVGTKSELRLTIRVYSISGYVAGQYL